MVDHERPPRAQVDGHPAVRLVLGEAVVPRHPFRAGVAHDLLLAGVQKMSLIHSTQQPSATPASSPAPAMLLADLTGLDETSAERLLAEAGGNVEQAASMYFDRQQATRNPDEDIVHHAQSMFEMKYIILGSDYQTGPEYQKFRRGRRPNQKTRNVMKVLWSAPKTLRDYR